METRSTSSHGFKDKVSYEFTFIEIEKLNKTID